MVNLYEVASHWYGGINELWMFQVSENVSNFLFAVILHNMTLNRNSTKVLFVLDRCLVTLSLELKSSTFVYRE